MRSALAALALTLAAAPPARACEVALVLAFDVSGSVDAFDYRVQAEGIAEALRAPDVADAVLRARAAIAVVQWSGLGQQIVSLPWTRVTEPADLARLATRIATLPRAYAGGNTAVGEALAVATDLFGARVRDCARWVIDISGDGDENEGYTAGQARRAALRRGITINALAIEGHATGLSITNFFRSRVITPGGFVETARGHADVARAMRRKLLRELSPPLAGHGPGRARLAAAAGLTDILTRASDGLFFGSENPMLASDDARQHGRQP